MSVDSHQPLVSVFLPTYNQSSYIGDAVESVLSQTYGNLEIVIGDDCSIDGTWDIVKEYKRKFPGKIKIFRNERNLGITGNCNEVLKRCTGEYIAFHAGDDVWLYNKVQKQIDIMETDKSCMLCYHDLEVFDESTKETIYYWNQGYGRPPPIVGDTQQVLHKLIQSTAGFIGALSVMIRQSALPDNVYYDERLPHLSELLIWVQVLNRSKGTVRYIPEMLARYRKHRNGISQKDNSTEYDIFLAIIENEYTQYLSAVRHARSRRHYSRGVRYILKKEYPLALKSLNYSFRNGIYSIKFVYWWVRALFGR